MILREFLYVDTDKVRGMLAQLDGGIVEEEREATRDDGKTQVGPTFAQHYQAWASERSVQKSLGDAMFPTLEDALEAAGALRDISDELTDPAYWTPDQLHLDVPPGSIIRVTALGAMFDARYVAATFAAFATAVQGLQGLGAMPTSAVPVPPAKRQQSGKRPHPAKGSAENRAPQLEDAIPDLEPSGSEFSSKMLRSIIRISRGMFTPGLHLNLFPTGDDRHTIGARLQEGRQFLDSDTDILFARYGVGVQEWTVVGSVGHYVAENQETDLDPNLTDGAIVRRAKTANYVNAFMGKLGSQGFADLPQYPALSMVPLAVYRVIPTLERASAQDQAFV